MPRFLSRRLTRLLAAGFLIGATAALSTPGMGQSGGQFRRQSGDERSDRQRINLQDMSPEQREQTLARIRERMAEREQQMIARQQELLGFSDDEFEVVGPMLQRVQKLATEQALATAGGRGAGGANRGGVIVGGQGGFGGMTAMVGDVATPEGQRVLVSTQALRQMLSETSAEPAADALKQALADLRSARQSHAAALKIAREDLRSVLSRKQEALLVLNGMLD